MPGLGAHLLVLDAVSHRLGDPDSPDSTRAGELLRAHRQYAAMGAMTQDLLYFVRESPLSHAASDLLVELVDLLAPLVKLRIQYIDPVAERIEDGLDWVTLGVYGELLKTVELFCANVEGEVQKLIVQTVDPWEVILPPSPLSAGHREVAGGSSWFWGDMLHYRCTGRFVQTLYDRAIGDAELEAFALGSATHIATDVAVHPLVNAIVGGPYRNHAHRHHFVENFLETLAWQRLAGENVLDAKLPGRLYFGKGELPEGGSDIFILAEMPGKLNGLIRESLRAVYPDPPRRIPGGYPTAEDLDFAYKVLLLAARLSNQKLDPPVPPAIDFATLRDLLEKLALDPPPGLPSPRPCRTLACALDAFQGLLEFAKWATVQIAKIAALPAAVLLGLSADAAKYLLHLIQAILYNSYRCLRRTLVWMGLAIPFDVDEAMALDREYRENVEMSGGRSLLSATSDDGYPHLADARGPYPFHHLAYPKTGTEELRTRASLVYGDALVTVLRDQSFDAGRVQHFLDQSSPEGTEAVSLPPLVPGGVGNAIDLSVHLIRRALANQLGAHDWNLDADRGYGWKTWSWGPDRPDPGSPGTGEVDAFYISCGTP